MTPKEQYEARKAARQSAKDLPHAEREKLITAQVLDMADRFVTAIERLADAAEDRS